MTTILLAASGGMMKELEIGDPSSHWRDNERRRNSVQRCGAFEVDNPC